MGKSFADGHLVGQVGEPDVSGGIVARKLEIRTGHLFASLTTNPEK
jgi:hypothetical protein